MEVLAAEFLPFEGQLYLVVVDADLDLHVLQYDPESAFFIPAASTRPS